jgi:L-fuculose-phosphate aldolase
MTARTRCINEIITTGRRLTRRGLVTACAGNISCRLDSRRILITATGSHLGSLKPRDIVAVDITTGAIFGARRPSSELPLHSSIYRSFADTAIVHCHPALINAYFCVCRELKYLTFESRYYLGEVPIVNQTTLTVADPAPVIAAMRSSGLVVLRNHGVFSRGRSCADALERIEILEEAVRVYALARLFNKKKPDFLDKALKRFMTRK